MSIYIDSIEKLCKEFRQNPANFVTESDLKVRLVGILRDMLRNETCIIKNHKIGKIPDSYKKEYYKEIQNKLANCSIDRVHTEVSVRKGKRFDVAVFTPRIGRVLMKGSDLTGGCKRFNESDLEAVFELKFVKNSYCVPKMKNGEKAN